MQKRLWKLTITSWKLTMTSIKKMCWYYYMVHVSESYFCNYCNILWLIVRVTSGFCRLNGSSSLFLSMSWNGSKIIFLKFWSGKIWIPMKNVIRKIWFHEFQRHWLSTSGTEHVKGHKISPALSLPWKIRNRELEPEDKINILKIVLLRTKDLYRINPC